MENRYDFEHFLAIAIHGHGRDVLKHKSVAVPPSIVVERMKPTVDDVHFDAEM
jgi:hypothetical protein